MQTAERPLTGAASGGGDDSGKASLFFQLSSSQDGQMVGGTSNSPLDSEKGDNRSGRTHALREVFHEV